MKIALIGYGKMGRMVETVALQRHHTISSRIGYDICIDADDTDIFIDFTHPDCAVDNISACASLGKSLVVGTTGWYERLPEVKKMVEQSNIGLLYAPNFAIGVHLFLRLAANAAKLFAEYDIAISEEHHNQKADRPSGTALALADVVNKATDRLPEISSLRCGSIPGTHTLFLDSAVDTITLTHTARSRLGMAEGAVKAAEWLQNRKGLFTLDDMLYENFPRTLYGSHHPF
jgi:4-hydroxy-tetrahydrodipicolinate reductase